MTSAEIISNVANECGDPGFEFLRKEEYIAIMNEVIREISVKTNLFYKSVLYTPTVGTNVYSLTDTDISRLIRVVFTNTANNYIYDLKETTLNKVQDALNNISDYYPPVDVPVEYYDNNNNPVLTITDDGPTSYNGKQLWYAHQINNGLVTLFVPWNFLTGDQLLVHYYSTNPRFETFNDTDIIWDYYAQILMEGMRWRCVRRLSYRKDTNDPKMWVYNKDWIASQQLYYTKFLPELIRYSRSMGSVSSAKEMKVFNLFDPDNRF
jgi:hypothetical protein